MIALNFTYKHLPNCVSIKTSSIDGLGLFAVEDIPNFFHIGCTHHIIQKGIMNSEQAEIIRTPLGGFINHSDEPNCEKWREDDKYFVKTIRHISKGEELFLKYTFYSVKS